MRTASLLALFGIVKREREALVIGASGMGTFYHCRSIVDGNGATLIAGRRDDTRAITKLSLFPNLFNINETAVFGMPVVFNPPMCVGFILAPLASYINQLRAHGYRLLPRDVHQRALDHAHHSLGPPCKRW